MHFKCFDGFFDYIVENVISLCIFNESIAPEIKFEI